MKDPILGSTLAVMTGIDRARYRIKVCLHNRMISAIMGSFFQMAFKMVLPGFDERYLFYNNTTNRHPTGDTVGYILVFANKIALHDDGVIRETTYSSCTTRLYYLAKHRSPVLHHALCIQGRHTIVSFVHKCLLS